MIDLSNIKAPFGATKNKRIKARGNSSGRGKTATRGFKGATSRSGKRSYVGFEGGQMPLIRRIPKRGFVSKRKDSFKIINIKDISRFKENSVIDPEFLRSHAIVKKRDRLIKLLSFGNIKNPIKIKLHAFSKNAKEKIEKSGGSIEIIPKKVIKEDRNLKK